jgi:hypothetical protein
METWKVYKCMIFVVFAHTSELQQNLSLQLLEVFNLD